MWSTLRSRGHELLLRRHLALVVVLDMSVELSSRNLVANDDLTLLVKVFGQHIIIWLKACFELPDLFLISLRQKFQLLKLHQISFNSIMIITWLKINLPLRSISKFLKFD